MERPHSEIEVLQKIAASRVELMHHRGMHGSRKKIKAEDINSAKIGKKVRSGPNSVMGFTETGPTLHYPLDT
jgi:hypothetical protein